MANRNTNVTPLPVVNAEPFTLAYRDYKVEFGSLTEASLHYLAQYGWAKSLQDSVAGLVKAVTTETDKAKRVEYAKKTGYADYHDIGSDASWAEYAEKIAAEIVTLTMTKRYESILEGPPSTKAGAPRARGIDKVMRDIAIEKIRAGILANPKLKLTMPKGEALNNTIAKVLAKHSDAIRADAERRMSIQGVDISELIEV